MLKELEAYKSNKHKQTVQRNVSEDPSIWCVGSSWQPSFARGREGSGDSMVAAALAAFSGHVCRLDREARHHQTLA